jgi:hypothetical protein
VVGCKPKSKGSFFCGEHQCDVAKCTGTANANDFQRQIHETVPVEQYFEVVCQTVAIASKNLLNVGAVALQVDKGMMKDEWRSLLDSVSAAIVFSQRGKVMLGNAALPFFLNALIESSPDSFSVNGSQLIA